jgi:hypothetical protein
MVFQQNGSGKSKITGGSVFLLGRSGILGSLLGESPVHLATDIHGAVLKTALKKKKE